MISWAPSAVHVRCHRRVIALASGFAVRRVIAVENPSLAQHPIAPVVRGHRQTRVVATLLDDCSAARSRSCPVPVSLTNAIPPLKRSHSVAVAVAPSSHDPAGHWIGHRRQFPCRCLRRTRSGTRARSVCSRCRCDTQRYHRRWQRVPCSDTRRFHSLVPGAVLQANSALPSPSKSPH